MLASAVRSLFRRPSSRPFDAALTALLPAISFSAPRPEASSEASPTPSTEAARNEVKVKLDWPPARLALVQQLWGAGFIFPGGETETLRLTRPLGVTSAASLLIVGVGGGGPATAVTTNLGAYVTAMDCDRSLLAAARQLVNKSQLAKKITIKGWDPDKPDFAARSHHHCLAFEPFHGACPEPIVHGLARALRPGGHMVITELTAPEPLNPNDAIIRRWGELERRDPIDVLAPVTVTRMLGRVGLDVRVAEDMSQRHLEHAMLGWRVLLRDLNGKPNRQEAVSMVAEAELWLLRRRLIREGRLQMMRWHAISGSVVA